MRIDGGEDADLDEFHGWQCKSTKISGPSASSAVKFCWSTTVLFSVRLVDCDTTTKIECIEKDDEEICADLPVDVAL
ncbi:hypothetical protein pipiens_018561 [Culex pipiens pipiens]|uniref:Uncharacterized protein n=1 Tax=Culex pipiens pipiens TaxID=38569 RepID=A0ABD1CBS8_CULPP